MSAVGRDVGPFAVRTWVRRPDELVRDGDDVLVWVKDEDGLFYVFLNSGVFKLASIVSYEGMTYDWEPCERSFLELGSAK